MSSLGAKANALDKKYFYSCLGEFYDGAKLSKKYSIDKTKLHWYQNLGKVLYGIVTAFTNLKV